MTHPRQNNAERQAIHDVPQRTPAINLTMTDERMMHLAGLAAEDSIDSRLLIERRQDVRGDLQLPAPELADQAISGPGSLAQAW